MSDDSLEYFLAKAGLERPPGYPGDRRGTECQIDALNGENDQRILVLIEDLLENRQYYRSSVNPRYHFDVPHEDLLRFLSLDGWEWLDHHLRRAEPQIVNLQEEEDALIVSLRDSGLPNTAVIENHLRRSAEEYGRDNNNSMTNSRQALEQTLKDIADLTAQARGEAAPPPVRVRDYLEQAGFLTQEEKRGFSGAYGFLSGGPHPGIVDQEAARLGRNFCLGACHYALQKLRDWRQNHFRNF